MDPFILALIFLLSFIISSTVLYFIIKYAFMEALSDYDEKRRRTDEVLLKNILNQLGGDVHKYEKLNSEYINRQKALLKEYSGNSKKTIFNQEIENLENEMKLKRAELRNKS